MYLPIRNLLRVIQHQQTLRVPRAVVAHPPLQPLHGLQVVCEYVKPREGYFLHEGQVPSEVRRQALHEKVWVALL